MRYVFMDNFRGFSHTLLPLDQITFLVGENSTGKSSFLKLLYMFSRPQFWFSPEFSRQEEAELGSFGDIVSAGSDDKSFFRVGVLSSSKEKKGASLSCSFTVHTFEKRDGIPVVSRYIQYIGGRMTKLIFQRKRIKYKIIESKLSFSKEEDITQFFNDTINADRDDITGFTLFPKIISPNIPVPIAVDIAGNINQGKPFIGKDFSSEIPFTLNLTWIAPIRTKPKRFYDGTKSNYSPEGDHIPFMLRRTLRTKAKSSDFLKSLKNFGEASGLFETVSPHSFGRDPQSPFEILVKFSGTQLNINNVGYGVSQVLPLIVEFLAQENNRAFAVQQPEVHLHPRAQAALGDLVYQLASDRSHEFIMETHSDYMIDRMRLNFAKRSKSPSAQVIFFQRTNTGNKATVIRIGKDGKYPLDQPSEFKDFFIKEEMKLLEI